MNTQNISKKRTSSLLIAGALLCFSASAFAEETTGEKLRSEARDAKVETKKNVRKAKKKVRDATGNSSWTEDAKDAGRNMRDSAEAGAKKMKDKID